MEYLVRQSDGSIEVACYAIQVYIPEAYKDSQYRGTAFYSMLGTKVNYFGVGNMRFFQNEKEMEDIEKVKCHPLGIPMLVMAEPTSIDIDFVRFSKGGRERRCIILQFYKGDKFLLSENVIKNSNATMMYLMRLEQGKLDTVPPEVAIGMLRDVQSMNSLNMRVPSEEEEIFVAERYRDPTAPGRQYRYHTGAADPDSMISNNSRVVSHKTSTYASLFGEDIGTGLIYSVNRHDDGIIDEPTMAEELFLGRDMSKYAEADTVTATRVTPNTDNGKDTRDK